MQRQEKHTFSTIITILLLIEAVGMLIITFMPESVYEKVSHIGPIASLRAILGTMPGYFVLIMLPFIILVIMEIVRAKNDKGVTELSEAEDDKAETKINNSPTAGRPGAAEMQPEEKTAVCAEDSKEDVKEPAAISKENADKPEAVADEDKTESVSKESRELNIMIDPDVIGEQTEADTYADPYTKIVTDTKKQASDLQHYTEEAPEAIKQPLTQEAEKQSPEPEMSAAAQQPTKPETQAAAQQLTEPEASSPEAEQAVSEADTPKDPSDLFDELMEEMKYNSSKDAAGSTKKKPVIITDEM